MAARDRRLISVLRTTLAAIANAEAQPLDDLPEPIGSGRLAEYPARLLSTAEIDAIIDAEIADREDTIEQYLAAGRADAADDLRAEIEIIAGYRRD